LGQARVGNVHFGLGAAALSSFAGVGRLRRFAQANLVTFGTLGANRLLSSDQNAEDEDRCR
jgi:hypothetical protein